jgi:hypothetical protein
MQSMSLEAEPDAHRREAQKSGWLQQSGYGHKTCNLAERRTQKTPPALAGGVSDV